MTTKEQKKHYSKIADLGCSLCRFVLGYPGTLCEIHHIRRAGKRSNAPVIGLCPEHHRGNTGVHGMGRKAWERQFNITEEILLEKTEDLINATK